MLIITCSLTLTLGTCVLSLDVHLTFLLAVGYGRFDLGLIHVGFYVYDFVTGEEVLQLAMRRSLGVLVILSLVRVGIGQI